MESTQSVVTLDTTWFARPVLEVAPELLGKYLVMGSQSGMITEVEAYDGPEDKACHASKGLTDRTKVMFGPAGYWYVYLCYGMYWMLNIVTAQEGYPSAVLLRGVGEFDGPGKLTKAFGIDGSFNAEVADPLSGLWIEDRGTVVDRYDCTPRIGVDYAKEWKDKPYRFVMV